jgi:uncharacterized protein (TIGR03437 family)
LSNTKRLFFPVFLALTFSAASSAQTCSSSSVVRMETTLGGIDIILTPTVTPITVANFLSYVCSGAYASGNFLNGDSYTSTIIHRSLNANSSSNAGQTTPFYLIQGGGFAVDSKQANLPRQIPNNGPISNEFKISNTPGTLAMAQLSGNINSATTQWFINISDNSGSLDSQSFTVFGNVANDAGMSVVSAIGALPTFAVSTEDSGTLTDWPLVNYTSGISKPANYVYVTSIAPIAPVTSAASFQSAATFASLSTTGISPGEIITLYGTELGPTQLTTLQLDSTGTLVTNLLEGTQVLFNGIPGPMIFTTSGQISTIVPYGIAGQSTVSVVVSYLGIQTSSNSFKVVPANPGLFTLNSSGKGDASIIQLDGTVVSSSNPASPGDVLELYGEGYGAISPAFPDGTVVTSTPMIPVTLLIDGKTVPTSYTGPAYGDVNGVLQINFTVPQQMAPGSHQIQIQVGSAVSPTGVTLATQATH